MQGTVRAHHPDDGSVATEDHQIEQEEKGEEQSLKFRDMGEHTEHKLGGPRLVEYRFLDQNVFWKKGG